LSGQRSILMAMPIFSLEQRLYLVCDEPPLQGGRCEIHCQCDWACRYWRCRRYPRERTT